MFGTNPGPISYRKHRARREVARIARTRALTMAILNYEAGRLEASEQWLTEAEYQETQIQDQDNSQ